MFIFCIKLIFIIPIDSELQKSANRSNMNFVLQPDLPKVTCPIVIISSTTGDGEPPENADRFDRKIHRKAVGAKTLHSVRYAILGKLTHKHTNSYHNNNANNAKSETDPPALDGTDSKIHVTFVSIRTWRHQLQQLL